LFAVLLLVTKYCLYITLICSELKGFLEEIASSCIRVLRVFSNASIVSTVDSDFP